MKAVCYKAGMDRERFYQIDHAVMTALREKGMISDGKNDILVCRVLSLHAAGKA